MYEGNVTLSRRTTASADVNVAVQIRCTKAHSHTILQSGVRDYSIDSCVVLNGGGRGCSRLNHCSTCFSTFPK